MSDAPRDLEVTARVRVPAAALEWRAVRSGGPGGQNVNKVATKVELLVEVDAIVGLTAGQRSRLRAACRTRLDGEGRVRLVSQRTRSQSQNVEDAREKLRALIADALPAPKARIPTRPSRAARARRLQDKRRTSQKKAGRRAAFED